MGVHPSMMATVRLLDVRSWEPPDSFIDGSEHFIRDFWLRVDTRGRDWQDLSTFKLGDELFPTGPPRVFF